MMPAIAGDKVIGFKELSGRCIQLPTLEIRLSLFDLFLPVL